MPMIEVHMIENVFTPAQKREIVTKLTDAMVAIEGENLRPYTLVKLHDIKSGDWAVGGQQLTTEAVKDMAARKRAA
ncbi:MAG TPA: tautomerase family protein [Rhizomicrobium sp.]|nr:tautomerase family protein [Rhizomicrobium sp.]